MKNLITVSRQPSQKDWTLSNFTADNGAFKGVGVEDEKREDKLHGETRIPNGVYPLGLRVSPKFSKDYYRDDEGNLILAKDRTSVELQQKYHTPHEMIWVKDVPRFQFILVHWGNTDDDTEGCYIVGTVFGKVKGQDGVLNSRGKYTAIYPIIWRALKAAEAKKEVLSITYKEAA
jgi:hypothetical protein